MISLVIGTDVPFVWQVKANGQPVQLDNHTVTLYVENSRGSFRLSDLVIEGDQVRATYPGAIQTRLGDHSLILRLNEGQKGMATVSVQNAFKLVAWGKDAGGENEGPVQVNALVFESELSFGNAEVDLSAYLTKVEAEKTYMKKGEGGGSYDDTKIRAELTELSAEVSGLSERIDNLPTAESSVFEAIYNTTTYDEIVEASNSGKVVICKHLTYIARLTSAYEGNVIFTASAGTTTAQLRCDSENRWYYNTSNAAHSLTTLDNGNAQITIAGKTAEVATPQYVENLLGTIINGDY